MAATTPFYMKIRNGNTPVPLPDIVRNGDAISSKWANSIRLALQRLRDRTPIITGAPIASEAIKPPLYITLYLSSSDPITWKVYSEYGHVVPRHNKSTDTGAPVTITDLPTQDTPLTVVVDTKLWVKETINDEGRITAAAFESGTAWEDDTPPELKGGDNTSGVTGYRYIRIAEIIADPDSTATPPNLICNQLLTGHIDHFQNELVENIDTSGANVLKEWDATAAKWMLRTIVAGAGITVTENADSIEIENATTPGTGIWGEFTLTNVNGSQSVTFSFENGLWTGISGSGITLNGTGTEIDQYSGDMTTDQ